MNKLMTGVLMGICLMGSVAFAGDDPDLQGKVGSIDQRKSIIVVKNELENKIGKRDYRVIVKQGMINDYKRNDTLKVWLMADRKEARHIERIDR